MTKYLVRSDDVIPWDGNVPSEPGTYFLVETCETLRVGSAQSATRQKPASAPSAQVAQPAAQPAAQPSQKAKKQKIEVSDEDDDLDSVEIPTKPRSKASQAPTVYAKGLTVYVTISGTTLERALQSESKAAELVKLMQSLISDPTASQEEVLDKLKSSGKWKVV